MKQGISIILVVLLVAGIGVLVWQKDLLSKFNSNTDVARPDVIIPEIKKVEKKDAETMEQEFDSKGNLVDVSGGNATGEAKVRFQDDLYTLVATFNKLPEPEGTDFYEGWIVRRSDKSIVSTGRVKEEEIGYVNLYINPIDMRDHNFYVLTLEPDDGNPAPATHILEGELQ